MGQIRDWLRYFFSFQARAPRSRFWLYYLFWLSFEIGGIAAFGLIYAIWIWSQNRVAVAIVGGIVFLPLWAATIPLTVGWFAVWTKRLHDRNRTGWWSVWPYVVIIAFMFERFRIEHSIVGAVFFSAGVAILIWLLLEVGFFRGTRGDNRFGPNPLAQKAQPEPQAKR